MNEWKLLGLLAVLAIPSALVSAAGAVAVPVRPDESTAVVMNYGKGNAQFYYTPTVPSGGGTTGGGTGTGAGTGTGGTGAGTGGTGSGGGGGLPVGDPLGVGGVQPF